MWSRSTIRPFARSDSQAYTGLRIREDNVAMLLSIVSTSERPDLAAVTARWRWDAFYRESHRSFEDVLAAANRTAALARLIPRTLVLLADGEPVGTASLSAHDLDERPDLTPWPAGMFVAPHARRQSYAARLIAAIEVQAAAGSIVTLWLRIAKLTDTRTKADDRAALTRHHAAW
jgi:GNAT superfamily N-acetyltransferase